MSLRKWMKKNLNETKIWFGKNLFLYIIIDILYFPLVPGDLEYYVYLWSQECRRIVNIQLINSKAGYLQKL